ncbi:PAS domain-containing hybrid sensor histidine kinase/response regulator [Flavobacterium urumqiense]|uniref:Sensory/regulatory protein RpfC n=1 Tax=Flavobacterium urumqiense TaxID=935224 RepID=A0A1H6ABR6_9FLAO|nr:PAS domain-containing hybrid sensor histidine kinase/response regulator [Flavobacterium urumqiense]SEG45487.1 PAS domain S-box-containing protein [Flavobacterium urumqiense]
MEISRTHNPQYTRSLIEASLDPFLTISLDGKITDVNEASIKITGISRAKLIGTDFSNYFTEREKAEKGYEEVFEKGFVADYPLTIKHSNGKLTDVLYNASVYKDEKGDVLGVFAAARDVTAQKLSSKYSLSLIEASLDPLVTINIGGKITDMNEATVNITGIERKKLIGSDFFDYFTEPQKAREVYQEVFAKGSVADSPLTLRHIGGKLTDVLFNGSVYRDDRGNVLGVVIVARDIAEQKWATELRSVNKELAYQNNEKEKRAEELVIANEELAYQNNEKEKRAEELVIANEELAYQNNEKEKRADELEIANKELAYQNDEKEKRAAELGIANNELAYQNDEKEKRAEELVIANKELAYQNDEKEKRADELVIANKELAYQNDEKEKRANELIIANKELRFQNDEKEKRAAELLIANKELIFQNKEKEKRKIENKELEDFSNSLKLASQYSLSLIEASRDPLFTISPKGKITDTNEASVRVTGIVREKLIGSDFFNYFTEPQEARKAYQEVFDKGFIADYPLTIKDHKLTDVLLNGSVYKNEEGDVLGVVVVARDITDQKRIEKESIEARLFAELATEIAEEAKLNAENATTIAEDAVKAKQQFLSNMSHEIRTPMNAIIGFTKVVLKTELSAKQKEYLTAIKMSGDALIVLINDILDLAKVDAGKMVFEKTPFKMKASISSMLHLFETKIQEKNLKLIKEYDNKIPAVLVGDPVRLHQIILNLVSNAVKFTNKGNITVGVHILHEDNEKVILEFAVTDTGIGIPKVKIDSIFENFQQATSGTSRLYGGTGLGLAIVKQLVEPQGGKIRVKSTIDVGTTFSFTLPFQKTNADAELENEILELDTEIKDIKVLVVEDIALNQLLMKTLLDDFGFGRDIAENGQIAIEKLRTQKYDIILMDLQMPVMNGFEATEYIRNTMNSKIPIIALTADVTTVDLAKCKSVGMNDYIAKPVDERVLYSKIVGILKKPKLEKLSIKINENIGNSNGLGKKIKCIDLVYLNQRTKSNPALMMEMISLYLTQTPSLINIVKQSLADEDWLLLGSTVHKMIPSFSIMGIHPDFENMAKKIQEYAKAQEKKDGIHDLVRQLEEICLQACTELEEEFNLIKNT